jgi:transcriptional regulator with XRE-family HTH domain
MERLNGKYHDLFMAKKPEEAPTRKRTFMREWRKHFKLTQEAAAARLDVEQGTLSKIERRELPYNQDFIERLAVVYGVDVIDILSVNPLVPDPPKIVYSKLKQASPAMQKKALEIIEALLKAS